MRGGDRAAAIRPAARRPRRRRGPRTEPPRGSGDKPPGGRGDRRILALDAGDRWRAAGVVFEAAHPAADAGDDRSAGPIMELVVEFWPNHAMALYHAGAARHALGDRQAAGPYLRRFLEHYPQEDGWRLSAETMLGTSREG